METEFRVSGWCPIQGLVVVDRHLFFFRARSGWSLSVWTPGRWNEDADDQHDLLKLAPVLDPCFEIDESDIDDSAPTPRESDGEYPGWWTHAYASSLFEWSVGVAMERIRRDGSTQS